MKKEKKRAELPLVSVIIPIYNCKNYLGDAVESILAQTYQPVEIIVVDDGSTDGSALVIEQYDEVRCIQQSHSGAGTARNQGIRTAQGNFLAFLDADDLWNRDKLSLQMDVLLNRDDLDMVFGHIKQFYSPELDGLMKKRIFSFADETLPGYSCGTLLIKRESFLRVGYFDPKWRRGEFIDWLTRARDKGLSSLLLPQVLMKRRLHSSNLGIREPQSKIDLTKIIKAKLDRRREIS
ncbi:glycosyltransferase family 2 protein [candidate division CSSED10-310 bacterium]|uniref:Glycosyltransferase family 2 protein n=1 Tax=candidate division CSSED10-310 bacterium TaxID=2855610 RepID=A0ABV6YUG9_UNCC1